MQQIDERPEILSRLKNVQTSKSGWDARCPAHVDEKNSLCISIGDEGKTLLHCQAGCKTCDVLKEIGMQFNDLFPKAVANGYSHNGNKNGKSKIACPYDYRNAVGEVVYQAVRMVPKDFRQRRPDGNGGWIWDMKGITRVLYRLPELLAADRSETVYIVEGEKDTDRLASMGLVATTNVGGAKKWLKSYGIDLTGRDVVILADNDQSGLEHAQEVAGNLLGTTKSVKILILPGLPPKGDVSDWLDADGTIEELQRIVADTPEFTPNSAPLDQAAGKVELPALSTRIRNSTRIPGGTSSPLSMGEILKSINTATGDWPRRVGGALFVHDRDDQIDWLIKPSSLFGWLGNRTRFPPSFSRAEGCHTKEEVHAELCRTTFSYESIETLPHEPPIAGHYYACAFPSPGDGTTLNALLDRFSPATDIDRDLILSMFATVIWGGPGGARPAYLITSDYGTGVGKSKLGAAVGEFAGGFPDISCKEDIATIKQRLLSADGIDKRVAMLDNVKSLKLSWAELESLITAPNISGKRLYVGEASRPNLIVWIITLNGASLSTDLAQRVVTIKVARPKYSEDWESETFAFIRENRQQIVADLIGFLRSAPTSLTHHTRWGTWERDVLSRLPEPSEAQKVIAERQDVADDEREEGELIEEHFAKELEHLFYDVNRDHVFIPSSIAAAWLNIATGERLKTQSAAAKLKTMAEKGKFHRLERSKSHSHGRGFFWVGEKSNPDNTHYDITERTQHQGRFR